VRIMVSGATATMRTLCHKYPQHLGVLITPQNRNGLCDLPLPWAVDNAAFSNPDDHKFFNLCVDTWGMTGHNPPEWVAVPDAVGDHRATLRLFFDWVVQWQAELGETPFPLAFVLQDGCREEEVPWDFIAAVFVGGTDQFKLQQSGPLIRAAKERGKIVHMGRVNSLKRIKFAHSLGVDSVDGTCFSRFPNVKIEWAIRYIQTL